MTTTHILINAVIGAAVASVLGTRRIGTHNWQYWAIFLLLFCGEVNQGLS